MSLSSFPRLTGKSSRWWRYGAIAMGSAPLIVALSVILLGRSLPLPPCLIQAYLGIHAPSCGLTRAFIALMQGDWLQALQYHAFSPVILLGLVLGVLMSGLELYWQRSLAPLYRRLLTGRVLWPGLISFAAYYALRLWVVHGSPDLPLGLDSLGLWQGFVAGVQRL